MQKLRNWIATFVTNHIEAVITGAVTLIFGGFIGWCRGFRDGTKRKEKELVKTKEALRKHQAQIRVLDERDKKNERRIRRLRNRIDKYESRIEELERELGKR